MAKRQLNPGRLKFTSVLEEDGTLTTDRERIVERSREFYEKLYSSTRQEPPEADIEQQFEGFPNIKAWEVKSAFKQSKKGKALGPDNITIDLIDAAGDIINDYFQIGAGLYAVGRPVQQKRTANLAPITPCPSREGPYSTVFSVSRPMDPLMWLAGLLAQSGDVETNPGPSTQTWTCDMCSTEHSINNNKTQQQINSKKTITIIQININGLTTKYTN